MPVSEIVRTEAGRVRGAAQNGVVAFKGIPYGDDTRGDGRFRPPRSPLPWDGVRDCLEYGQSCPQIAVSELTGHEVPADIEAQMGVGARERSLGEDCLVLNVWTPNAGDGGARPVLVWLHGGGMAIGSASWPLYDFTNLARNNDVVVVGINHRLGVLGFLDLSHLDEEFADSGNVGMLDIVAALEWVRENIAAFGGDPSNVTVFGESGGSNKVTCLLAMPSARRLFRNACAMSGVLLEARTRDAARVNAEALLDHLGVDDNIDTLTKLDADAIVRASLAVTGVGLATAGASFGPTLSPSLPEHPVDAARAGSSAGVNVVLGCTTHEMVTFMGTPEVFGADEEAARGMVMSVLGPGSDTMFEAYRALHPGESPASLFLLIVSDAYMRMRHIQYAEALLSGGAPAPYMYLFDFRRPSLDGVPRAGHGTDMPYFFDNIDKAPLADGPHARPLVRAMSSALVALARNGEPNHDAIPPWPPYSTSERATMILDVEPRIENDPFAADRQFWEANRLAAGQ